ncbi:hypothetical protein RUM43_007363 [Polyplax serrata]|uniref:non-specific serine/threonine protein kinase n=1 Tax=Polyplax serrata TaxID=468196 RepID=A0AAN8S1J1_POLSC
MSNAFHSQCFYSGSLKLVIVSTLDGKVTALNPNNKGSVAWAIHPGSESMLSSSIHKLELSNYGHLVRMIPSLDGGLYRFNGENIEVVPVTSDYLLQSSMKYSDDLVISGGKETHTFGVSLQTGNTIYECSMKNCGNVSHSTDVGDVLVIQRRAQTVRAVEPRTGTEKWNFSVAQHELKLITDSFQSFQNEDTDYKLRVVIPEGIIYAADTQKPDNILWKQKLNSPIINVWQIQKGKLIQVDLFSSQVSVGKPAVPPSIYIGMYHKQESNTMLRKRHEVTLKTNQNVIVKESNYPVIPWKPILAMNLGNELTWEQDEVTKNSDNSLDDPSQRQTTALSVLYASPYVDGNGFFLYSEEDLQKLTYCNASEEDITIEEEPAIDSSSESKKVVEYSELNNTTVEIVVVSFWYYWKEVLVISATTALICNLMIQGTYMRWKFKDRSSSTGTSGSKTETVIAEKESGVVTHVIELDNDSKLNGTQEYTSRYLMDFEPVACLGKGGFGVVFEAKNKIDDCHYAIKRILLPRRQESRDRVLREVKALAKLDHHHIVRYFNAWTECPPSGWQEKKDRLWLDTSSELWLSNMSSPLRPATYSTPSNIIEDSGSEFNDDSKMESSMLKKELLSDVSDSFVVFGETSVDIETKSRNVSNNISDIVTFDHGEEASDDTVSSVLAPVSCPLSLKMEKSDGPKNTISKVYLFIQMQLCQRNSLRDWLIVNEERNYDHVLGIFEQILQAVEHVHLHGLIHRDLKPSNIFFSLDNQIKVGDFGLVTAMTEGDTQISKVENIQAGVQLDKHTAQVGTQLYMSPEQLLGKPYNYKVDIYSLGLILFELLVPFGTQMERIRILQDVKKDTYPTSFKKAHNREYELLRLMLSDSPEERPTTYGIRARLPLAQENVEKKWHFELPGRKSPSTKILSGSYRKEDLVFT